MEKELLNSGFEVSREFGGNNVVGILSNGDGPVILLRTDMDALPLKERTGFSFTSTKVAEDPSGNKVPVMHACGHDIHMSVWAGTIRSLVELKDKWSGTIIAIAQQAEEMSGGAGLAIEHVISSIERICNSAALAAGMPSDKLPEITIVQGKTPPVLNNPELTVRVRKFASEAIGEENIINTAPAMVGEDFGRYGHTEEKVPINLIWLGSTSPELMQKLKEKGETPPPLHSPDLTPDYKKTIETGIRVMVGNLIGLFNN